MKTDLDGIQIFIGGHRGEMLWWSLSQDLSRISHASPSQVSSGEKTQFIDLSNWKFQTLSVIDPEVGSQCPPLFHS